MLDKETLKYLNEIEVIAYRCVVDEHYFEIVTENTKNDFWNVVQNALGDGVCIYWSHLFVNNKDDLHYSNFFKRQYVIAEGQEYTKAAVMKRILALSLVMTITNIENFGKKLNIAEISL